MENISKLKTVNEGMEPDGLMDTLLYLHIVMTCRYDPVISNSPVYSTKRINLLYIYSIPPDDGLHIWPKHVEVY